MILCFACLLGFRSHYIVLRVVYCLMSWIASETFHSDTLALFTARYYSFLTDWIYLLALFWVCGHWQSIHTAQKSLINCSWHTICLVLFHSANKQYCVHKSFCTFELESWQGSFTAFVFLLWAHIVSFSEAVMLFIRRYLQHINLSSTRKRYLWPVNMEGSAELTFQLLVACCFPHFCLWLIIPL